MDVGHFIISKYKQPYDKSMVEKTINYISKELEDSTKYNIIVVEQNDVGALYKDSLVIHTWDLGDVMKTSTNLIKFIKDKYSYFSTIIFYRPGYDGLGEGIIQIDNFKDVESNKELDDWLGLDILSIDVKEIDTNLKIGKSNHIIKMNDYFDNIYCINLTKDFSRYSNMKIIFDNFNIVVDRWVATTDTLFRGYKCGLKPKYLACLNSHLSIIEDALEKGYDKILIMEDDIVPVRDLEKRFSDFISEVPDNWDFLYLSYIRTDDEKTMWTYRDLEKNKISDNVVVANNFWSAMCYGISRQMMERVVKWYKSNNPIEIDRFYVENVQRSGMFFCYGSFPQIFAGVDIYSNTEDLKIDIFNRSINSRYQGKNDFLFPKNNFLKSNLHHPNNYYDKIFCINVPDNIERRNNMIERFKKNMLNVSFFEAYTPKDQVVIDKHFDINDIKAPTSNNNTNIRTLSVFMSHMKLIKHCIDKEYQQILILEDDVIFRKDFLNIFDKSLINKPKNCDLWLLGSFQYDWNKTMKINSNFYKTSECLGFFAYSLNLDGAKKLYAELEKLINFNLPIDLAIRDYIMKKEILDIVVSWPFIIGHENNISTINNEFVDMSRWFPPDDFDV